MKNIVVNYNIFTNKINDKKILVLSDIHDYPWKRNNKFVDDIVNAESDLILIPGDLMISKKYSKGSLSLFYLKDFLRIISEKSPVFLGMGSYELDGATIGTIQGYRDLEKSREGRVFSLYNESIEMDDLRITEFHPRHSAFSNSIQKSGKALLDFYNDYEDIGFDSVKDDKKYNILLCHNPKLFAQARSIGEQLKLDLYKEDFDRMVNFSNKMANYDLVVSGHMHNGYIPVSKTVENPEKYLDNGYCNVPIEKDINGEINFIRPWLFKKTDMCRGTIYIGGTDLRIIHLCNGKYYIKDKINNPISEITKEKALQTIETFKMVPIVISGGVNKYYLPFDSTEVTQVKILKK